MRKEKLLALTIACITLLAALPPFVVANSPPATPSPPSGPSSGYVYADYNYTAQTTDPENETIWYEFWWGDGTTTLVGPYASGQNGTATHQWNHPRTYYIYVRAKDVNGYWSYWSGYKIVTLTQNDANSGRDAGYTPSTALYVLPGSYKDTLHNCTSPLDTEDRYNFTAYNTHRISVSMTPPSDIDFDLELRDPGDVRRATSKNGPGATENITMTANIDGNWSIVVYAVTVSHDEGQYSFTIVPTNYPPAVPSAPSGPSSGFVYTSYTFSTSTTDRESDTILYEFHWNDSTTTTVGPYWSGYTASASHWWKKPITYYIKVRARDYHGFWSDWSAVKNVTLTQNDADSGGDAGNNHASAFSVCPAKYKGTLYHHDEFYDSEDWYKFNCLTGDRINITMTPASGVNYDLELHQPDGQWRKSSTRPNSEKENITYQATSSGNWSIRIWGASVEGIYNYTFTVDINDVPWQPSTPSGVSLGYVYSTYAYTTSTIDPAGHNVTYEFDWGDGTFTTTGQYRSGATASASHLWTHPFTYSVRVRAKDVNNAWSCWSNVREVTLRQNDGSSGADAGNTFETAVYSYQGTRYGNLYNCTTPLDLQDWFKFWADLDDRIRVTMTPPANVDFDLLLYDPNGNLIVSSRRPAGEPESITYFADVQGYWRFLVNATNSGHEGRYSYYLQVGYPHGCPYLYVYDGNDYASEGLLDIHDATGTDVVLDQAVIHTPERVNGVYKLRLIEHPLTYSHIDEVKLYAILEDKTVVELRLISAVHSEYGNVMRELWFSDDWKTELKGADHNNGVSQSIDLKFLALPPSVNAIGFYFVIEGNNMIIKPEYPEPK